MLTNDELTRLTEMLRPPLNVQWRTPQDEPNEIIRAIIAARIPMRELPPLADIAESEPSESVRAIVRARRGADKRTPGAPASAVYDYAVQILEFRPEGAYSLLSTPVESTTGLKSAMLAALNIAAESKLIDLSAVDRWIHGDFCRRMRALRSRLSVNGGAADMRWEDSTGDHYRQLRLRIAYTGRPLPDEIA